ncbi:MAG: type II toxin-antitoxin system VapB family antitoxin [Hyphomicrobiales bacterium]
MTFYVKDPATDKAVRKLAKLKNTTLTEAIRRAVETELLKERRKTLPRRLDAIAQRLRKYPRTGLDADKAFFDDLSGDG